MNPFDFQVQAITHHSVGALCAVKAGTYIAQPEIPLVGYEALQKMISDAQEALRQITPEEINRHEDGEVVFRFKDFTLPFTTEHFLLSFALPNFYFHAALGLASWRKRVCPYV